MLGYLNRLLPVALLMVVLLQTSGCETTSPFRGGSPAQAEKKQAQQLIDRGDYAGAAALYESAAAGASGDKRTFLLLSAAENYLRARDAISAQGAFAQTRRPTSGNLALHYRIVDSELAMARSQPAEAERALGPTPSLAAPSSLRLSYYRAQAKILSALNRRAPQADARMRLSDLATDNAERYANQQQLLRLLATLNEEERESCAATVTRTYKAGSHWPMPCRRPATTLSKETPDSANGGRNTPITHRHADLKGLRAEAS